MNAHKPRDPQRRWWVHGLLSAIALILLAAAVRQNWDKIEAVFARRPDARLFALGFALYLSATSLTFVRWFALARALGLPFAFRDAVRLGFIGNVFNLVIPGAVGGDVLKAAFLCREHPERKPEAIASVVLDRIIGLLGLFLLGVGGGLLDWRGADPGVRRLIVAVIVAASVVALILAIAFTPQLYRPLRHLFGRRRRPRAALDRLIGMAGAYHERPGVVALAAVLAMLTHSLYVVIFFLIGRALFPAVPSLVQHFIIVPLALFSTAIPLPFGALGLSEQISDRLFAVAGHPSGAVAMMGFRVVMYAVGLVSIGVYLANLRQVRALEEQAEALEEVDAGPLVEDEPPPLTAQAPWAGSPCDARRSPDG